VLNSVQKKALDLVTSDVLAQKARIAAKKLFQESLTTVTATP